ncbi:hypothetical protein HYT23_03690 [Candidatus Pacearchaeota archaeon]|nr:hypothetical protein [Candidatus Pacearchaeota archaeon]
MKKKKNILFICKYNRFRSRVAEAYFNKINKNKLINVKSAGIIKGFLPLDKAQVRTAKSYGIFIKGKPKSVSSKMLSETDEIIIVANDVPKGIFKFKNRYIQKIHVWKVPDVLRGNDILGDKKIIEIIMKKVEGLIKELKKLKRTNPR